jgi:dCMP deaminase
MTAQWNKSFVIFPLSSSEDINIMISRYYFILFEVDAPIKMRFNRFLEKYQHQDSMTLDEFVSIDDMVLNKWSSLKIL